MPKIRLLPVAVLALLASGALVANAAPIGKTKGPGKKAPTVAPKKSAIQQSAPKIEKAHPKTAGIPRVEPKKGVPPQSIEDRRVATAKVTLPPEVLAASSVTISAEDPLEPLAYFIGTGINLGRDEGRMAFGLGVVSEEDRTRGKRSEILIFVPAVWVHPNELLVECTGEFPKKVDVGLGDYLRPHYSIRPMAAVPAKKDRVAFVAPFEDMDTLANSNLFYIVRLSAAAIEEDGGGIFLRSCTLTPLR